MRWGVATVLILGGTAWLGAQIAGQCAAAGDQVTCLARGSVWAAPPAVTFLAVDRTRPDAYQGVADRDWDRVVDVSWQPGQVASAVEALGHHARHWTYVSSCSVYADHATPGADETAARHAPLLTDEATMADYAGAKVRCEDLVTSALGTRALLVRAGLIAGPGDPSDRFGYWVGRFALAGSGAVLIPDEPRQWTQAIDVRDLAAWIVAAGSQGAAGAVNAVGQPTDLGAVLAGAARIAEFAGTLVPVESSWLRERGVEPWAGPRSLPLWLPDPDYAGFGARDGRRAKELGLTRRDLDQTLRDTLIDERARGLGRDRRAGLTRHEELALLEAWAAGR